MLCLLKNTAINKPKICPNVIEKKDINRLLLTNIFFRILLDAPKALRIPNSLFRSIIEVVTVLTTLNDAIKTRKLRMINKTHFSNFKSENRFPLKSIQE